MAKVFKWLWEKLKKVGRAIYIIPAAIVAVVVYWFVFCPQNKDYYKEAEEAKEKKIDELNKKSASDIIDNELSNPDDVRATIESGRLRFTDRARSAISRLGRAGVHKGDNSSGERGDPEDS